MRLDDGGDGDDERDGSQLGQRRPASGAAPDGRACAPHRRPRWASMAAETWGPPAMLTNVRLAAHRVPTGRLLFLIKCLKQCCLT
jgi:hypothetical protein